MTELLALGMSHKTAPVALRERVALPDGLAEEFLAGLVADPAIQERIARENFGMVRGTREILYRFVDHDSLPDSLKGARPNR